MTGNPVRIRFYVYLLVAVLVLLSASAIGFLYWQEAGFRKMQEIQAAYYLRTANYCARIKEELTQINTQELEIFFRSYSSATDIGSQQERGNLRASLYLIEEYLDAIVDLQTKYQVPKFEATVQKAKMLGDQLIVNQGSAEPMDEGVSSRLQVTLATLSVAADQLERLHSAAHDELALTLSTRRQRKRWNFFVFVGMVLLGGVFVTRQVLARISFMVRKQAEVEQMLRNILQTAPDAIVEVNRDGCIVLINAQTESLFGYHREELLGQPVENLLPERFRELHPGHRTGYFLHPHKRPMGEGLDLYGQRKDGSEFPVEITLSPVETSEGILVTSIIRDITERKQAEEALRQSEAAYRSLIQGAAYGICRSTADGKFLDVNPALVAMLGYDSEAELLAANLATEIYRDAGERARLVEQYQHQDRFDGLQVEWKRKDGTPITVRLSGRAVRDAQGKLAYYEGIAENITEQRLLEAQLRQAQKMEAVGQLAGGVAHDFNNLLMVIQGYSEVVLSHLGQTDPLRGKIEEIQKAADRATSLTQQLLAFSRKQVFQAKALDLNTIVVEMDKLLRRLVGEDIERVTLVKPGLGRVKADQGQIEQIILNLAVNARDAMPHGGKLIVETSNVELDEGFVRSHPLATPGQYVLLVVSDTWVGMDAETQSHIFEPFFTTKEKGKGTGLGLSTVYGIVRQSGGYIWVYSEPGQGTTFKVYLPRIEETGEKAKLAEAIVPPARGSETVLVVEDEMSVRRLAREFLEGCGYDVLEAIEGGEALRVAEQHKGPIHLLLTDVVMPGMTGSELAQRLGPLQPEMKVLYMSGYTDDSIIHHGVLESGVTFLQKPFTLDALARKVRHVLEAGRGDDSPE